MERVTRAKAIKLKCLDCCCGIKLEVRKCTAYNCPLWRYRTGKETSVENDEFSDDFEDEELEGQTILDDI